MPSFEDLEPLVDSAGTQTVRRIRLSVMSLRRAMPNLAAKDRRQSGPLPRPRTGVPARRSCNIPCRPFARSSQRAQCAHPARGRQAVRAARLSASRPIQHQSVHHRRRHIQHPAGGHRHAEPFKGGVQAAGRCGPLHQKVIHLAQIAFQHRLPD